MQTYHKSQWAPGDPPADRTAVLIEESGQTKNNDALLERSAALVHTEHYAEAKKILNSILAQEPQNGQARYLNGNVCVALNDIAQAKENYEIAIKAGYVTSKVIMSLALVEKVLGQEYKAEKHLRGLLEKEPDALVPKVLLYSLYAEQRRFEDAAKVAEGMADAFPESYGGCHAQLQADWGQKNIQRPYPCWRSRKIDLAQRRHTSRIIQARCCFWRSTKKRMLIGSRTKKNYQRTPWSCFSLRQELHPACEIGRGQLLQTRSCWTCISWIMLQR